MSPLMLLLGSVIVASPSFEAGLQGGGGIIQDQAILSTQPWIGATQDGHSLSLAAPLRLELASGDLRSADWDEWRDYGRVFRFYRFEEQLHLGQINDLTLGHGTVARRFRNGIDDDHYRVGAEMDLGHQELALHAFCDQVLDVPVFGVRPTFLVAQSWSLGATFAADAARPRRAPMRQTPTRELWSVVGLDLGWSPVDEPIRRAHVYLDLNLQQAQELGLHLGMEWQFALAGPWAMSGRIEAMGFDGAYAWAPFDTGYLIRRWTSTVEPTDFTLGGRLMLVFTALEQLTFGIEYADAVAPGRADLSVWTSMPFSWFRLDGFWTRRDGYDRLDLFDPRDMLGGLSLRLISGEGLDFGITAARAWRNRSSEGRFRPYTEVLLTLERGWNF